MTTALAPAPPRVLGRYEIQSEIGRGAMGIVYKAADPVLGRSVALKVIHVTSTVSKDERRLLEQRFLREATLAASLSHPNIVVVHDVGWDPQECTPFIALEYLEGRTLSAAVVHGEPMDWRAALRMTGGLAEALHHAHGRGIVHRDIKPSNIMILRGGLAKLLDFGVARAAHAPLTAPGELWGTPLYMSPEQATGRAVDGRSDLFSLGAVLYEVLTARRAFAGEGVAQIVHRLLHAEPPPPSHINPALPAALDIVVARALAKDPNERYSDANEFLEDMEDVLHERRLRERRLACRPPDRDAVEWRPYRPADLSPPTLTTGWRARDRGRRPAGRRARAVALGVAMGGGLVAIALAAGTETVHTAPRVTAAPTVGAPTMAVLMAPPPPNRVRVVTPPPVFETARVAITLEHRFKEGRIKVWVDDKVVLDQPLASAAKTRSVLFFKKRRGLFADVVNVAPGERTVVLEVNGDGQTSRARVSGLLRKDQTRLLAGKAGGTLNLAWKS